MNIFFIILKIFFTQMYNFRNYSRDKLVVKMNIFNFLSKTEFKECTKSNLKKNIKREIYVCIPPPSLLRV